ncbi:hypothetical protein VZ236_01365, partial [Metamycoplasma hominis]|uniref:hypothetical protein n=1 Tax=Metamycoplasma hominis TaxID=2098 RepID=UPI0034A2ABC9
KTAKSREDTELSRLRNELQNKINEFDDIKKANVSWISKDLESSRTKLLQELNNAEGIKNNNSSSKRALTDSKNNIERLGQEFLKAITTELSKEQTKNQNLGYGLYKLSQKENYTTSEVAKLQNAWENSETLLSKKQKKNNESTKQYLNNLFNEIKTQESAIKNVIVGFQEYVRDQLNQNYRIEAEKIFGIIKGYGEDTVGIQNITKWQQMIDDSVLNVDKELSNNFEKAMFDLIGTYPKNDPKSPFIKKRDRCIETYKSLKNLILTRENEILLAKGNKLAQKAQKTIDFINQNSNKFNSNQQIINLKNEINRAKKDWNDYVSTHEKNQFTAKDIKPKIELLENKLNQINPLLLPIAKQIANEKITQIDKNAKELEGIVRINFYLYEKTIIDEYIRQIKTHKDNLNSKLSENNWEHIYDELQKVNIKNNVDLLKEVIINNNHPKNSINKVLILASQFSLLTQSYDKNNVIRSFSDQFKFVSDKAITVRNQIKAFLDNNTSGAIDSVTAELLRQKLQELADKLRELKGSLIWFDNQGQNITNPQLRKLLSEIRENLNSVYSPY